MTTNEKYIIVSNDGNSEDEYQFIEELDCNSFTEEEAIKEMEVLKEGYSETELLMYKGILIKRI